MQLLRQPLLLHKPPLVTIHLYVAKRHWTNRTGTVNDTGTVPKWLYPMLLLTRTVHHHHHRLLRRRSVITTITIITRRGTIVVSGGNRDTIISDTDILVWLSL